jgi:hypothetical protein
MHGTSEEEISGAQGDGVMEKVNDKDIQELKAGESIAMFVRPVMYSLGGKIAEDTDTKSLTFGERLRLARTRKKLKQSDFGLSKGFISDVENGKRDMSGKNIIQACKILDVTPNWLLLGWDGGD